MLTPAQALEEILARTPVPTALEEIPLTAAAGRVLARAAVSDVDLPPFEKSMMDGFAVRSADFEDQSPRSLRCIGESRAGEPFDGELEPGTCIEIYTGAELPASADAVEMIEYTERDGTEVRFERSIRRHQNVGHRGEILSAGTTVFGPGRRVSAADLSVLAAAGVDPVPVFQAPRVSVLTTGDELVPPAEVPGPGQIREGNTLFLASACEALGCTVRRAGIVRDERSVLEQAFAQALEEGDALITTGGVSMGKYDLVGDAFEAIGVEPVLHKVAIKPGKPIWFGMAGSKPVFGLPGNPVSSLLGFEVFVRPALARLAGLGKEEQCERVGRAIWLGPEARSKGRQHHLPARLKVSAEGVQEIEPVVYHGSADVLGAARADVLAVVPADGVIQSGELVDYRPLG